MKLTPEQIEEVRTALRGNHLTDAVVAFLLALLSRIEALEESR